jgi:HEPN domain-containing protein
MPDSSDALLSVVMGWVEKAENDLKNATHTLELGEEGPTDTVCFHAQQCVEKYLKALLVLRGIEFRRIHDIGALVALLPEDLRPDLSVEEQEQLTDYAVTTRYPGDYDLISLDEAQEAVEVAQRVRQSARQNLPEAVSSD